MSEETPAAAVAPAAAPTPKAVAPAPVISTRPAPEAVAPRHPAEQTSVPYERFATVNEKLRATQAEHASMSRELLASRQNNTMVRISHVHPNLGHPDIQRFFRSQYSAYSAENGEQSQSFDQWLVSDQVQGSPLFTAHFNTQTESPAATVEATREVAAPPANVSAGAQPSGAPPAGWTSESIARSRIEQGGRHSGKRGREIAEAIGINTSRMRKI